MDIIVAMLGLAGLGKVLLICFLVGACSGLALVLVGGMIALGEWIRSKFRMNATAEKKPLGRTVGGVVRNLAIATFGFAKGFFMEVFGIKPKTKKTETAPAPSAPAETKPTIAPVPEDTEGI